MLTKDKITKKLRKYALENKEPCYRYILAGGEGTHIQKISDCLYQL